MNDPMMQKTTSPDGMTSDSDSSARTENPQSQKSSEGRSLFGYTIAALAVALIVRFFIAAPYVVSGASMEPNFDNWDYLITDRLTYRFEEPSRGDIIVFHLPQDPSRTLIKRIIGLPGETIRMNEDGVEVFNDAHPDGLVLEESYLSPENRGGLTPETIELQNDQYFVLGDNRRVSSDSRIWGPLPKENIIGRVLIRLFPFSHVGVLPAEARYE